MALGSSFQLQPSRAGRKELFEIKIVTAVGIHIQYTIPMFIICYKKTNANDRLNTHFLWKEDISGSVEKMAKRSFLRSGETFSEAPALIWE